MDTLLEILGPYRIRSYTGGTTEQVDLHPTDAASQLQRQCHLCLNLHPHYPVTMPVLKFPKLSICVLDILILILVLPAVNNLPIMHMAKITCTIRVGIQIC
jgi:hypothetical protein